MRTLKIGLIAPGIPRRATGPAFWIKELAAGLCAAGCEVTVIAGDVPRGSGKPEPIVPLDPRAKVVLFPARSHLEWRFHYNPSLRRWLEDNVAGLDVVDIQGIWSFVTAAAARICIRVGVPYILTPHGQMAVWDWRKKSWQKRAFFWLMIRTVWRAAAAVRFTSHGEMQRLQIGHTARAAVIPYWINARVGPVDHHSKALTKRRLGIPENSALVMFLGRISAQKGVLEIVLAFDRLWRERPSAFLALVGPRDRSYGSEVLRTIERLPCKPNIRVLDGIYDERKYDLLAAASLFITLSKNEGLPIAVLEAMACGLPVLITEYANLPEVSLYGAGRIVSSESAPLANAIEELLANPAQIQQMGERGKRLVAERFSLNVVLPNLLALYERVARSGKPIDQDRAAV
jgi:glycosyltransferase involved in cell wall biosynthesis